jgi:hypothetical protein
MLFILLHLADDSGICKHFAIIDFIRGNQLDDVGLHELQQFGEELVVVCFVLARWKSAIY